MDSSLLGQPRRAAADRLVRPHRLHRHVALDRSGDADVRRVPVEPRPSRRQGRRHAAARAGCDDRRVGARRDCRRISHARRSPAATSAARRRQPPGRCTPVVSGLDALRAEGFAPLRGKRVGLVTNHTGRARDGATTIDLLFEVQGRARSSRSSAPSTASAACSTRRCRRRRIEKTGLSIHSLYGETRRPTAAMLEGLDAIVIDLQDIGARFYTYITTMAYRDGGGGEAEAAGVRARSAEPDQRLPDRGPGARQVAASSSPATFRRCRCATA